MQKQQLIMLLLVSVAAITLIVSVFMYLSNNTNEEEQTELLKAEVREKIKAFKLKKLIRQRDLILKKENFTQISQYQKYVTPAAQAVVSYVTNNSILTRNQAYEAAVDWVWVSDQILHGKQEHWMFPSVFLQTTSMLPTNPVSGRIASDCESQAYTLVSILEATGVSYENVRVVVGKVDFSGEIGGHAWVQIYQNGEWFELEPTSGPFWDEEDNKLVENMGMPFSYFLNRPYPVLEYWAFFNDVVFYNPHNGKQSSNLPSHWLNLS